MQSITYPCYTHLMFTGIIETTAAVLQKTATGLTLERPASFTDIKEGASIAVSGVCLSVVQFDEASMRFDVVEETWKRTKLGSLTVGDRVNLERSMRADGRFEGHIVQGHIEGVGTVVQPGTEISIRIPSELVPMVVYKGSIALDGVSLTVARVEGDICTIALIPHTLEVTTFGALKEGDSVNIETDILGRYAYAMLQAHKN